MAKIYEALRRAEEERKQHATGTDSRIPAVEWDATPQTAPKRRGESFLARWMARRNERPADTAADLNKRRISLLQPESFAAEQFRTLRSRIDSLATQRPIISVAITSANPGDGKTTAALNLAVVSAMGVGCQVLLIDSDLRRPSIHRSLGLEPTTRGMTPSGASCSRPRTSKDGRPSEKAGTHWSGSRISTRWRRRSPSSFRRRVA